MVESNTNVDISARNVDLMANKLQLFQYHDRYLIIQIMFFVFYFRKKNPHFSSTRDNILIIRISVL
jgi:hypothetical protein